MTNPTQTLEQAIVAAVATKAPRITPDDIEANIVHTEVVKHITPSGKVLRWGVITCKNGFAVTGKHSASVSVENDRAAIGESVAIDNARDEMWALMGYELSSKLTSRPSDFKGRVHAESEELYDRIQKLSAFTHTDIFGGLPKEEQDRLTAQLSAMCDYSSCLDERIQNFA